MVFIMPSVRYSVASVRYSVGMGVQLLWSVIQRLVSDGLGSGVVWVRHYVCHCPSKQQ